MKSQINLLNNKLRQNKGFTLIELLVVIAIISLLSSLVLSSTISGRIKARDALRLHDITQTMTTLDLYLDTFGQYPNINGASCGGWNTSGNGTFLAPLISNGYLTDLNDPTISNDCGNYAYFRYPAGYAGCPISRGAFYILGIRSLESIDGAIAPNSPGWSCPLRNWQSEFNWVMGKYENS